MESRFVEWRNRAVKKAAVVMDLKGYERSAWMSEGASCLAEFPSTASFHFNPSFRKDTALADSLINVESMIVASQRLKDFIERKAPPQIEYLRVSIIDLKGKPVDEPFYIVHPLAPVECIDLEKSELTWSESAERKVLDVERLVIQEDRVPDDRLILRPRYCPSVLLVHRELALELQAAGFTGVGWREL